MRGKKEVSIGAFRTLAAPGEVDRGKFFGEIRGGLDMERNFLAVVG